MYGRPSGPQDRTPLAKLETPFGHAFDKRGYRCLKALCAPAFRPWLERVDDAIAAALEGGVTPVAPRVGVATHTEQSAVAARHAE